MRKFYRIAGMEMVVDMSEEIMYSNEHRLAPFAVEQVEDPHVYYFKIVNRLSEPAGTLASVNGHLLEYRNGESIIRYAGISDSDWSSGYLRAEHCGKEHYVQLLKKEYSGRVRAKVFLESMAAEHIIARNNGFVFHCAYIAHRGKAILFTAPSETGKSTQAELWKEHRGSEIINGDRAAVRLEKGMLLAEGIPFSGSSTYCENRSLPIQAVVYLGQAPQTMIRKLRGAEAFRRIWEGVSVNTWDTEDMKKVSFVVEKLAENVPIFHLQCTPDESAVQILEQALGKLEKEND